MKCPRCYSSKISKNGRHRGYAKRYKCQECDRQFLESYTLQGYSAGNIFWAHPNFADVILSVAIAARRISADSVGSRSFTTLRFVQDGKTGMHSIF
ncbi:IS1/IS1595 family N-terminal zinc-binding domain-containing protein [Halomicronema hongdechloris]